MSWAEVFKINSNMTKPLNTLISELISGVTTKITGVETKVGTVDTKVGNVGTQVTNVATQVSNIATQVNTVNTNVGNINTNVGKVSTQIRDSRFLPLRIITSTGTYTPEKTGTYKVICVGAGGNGDYGDASNTIGGGSGGGGGVAIKTLRLVRGTNYSVTVSYTASFTYNASTIITATSGGRGDYDEGGSGGTASGGDSNYPGTNGSNTRTANVAPMPGSVGVHISELSMTPAPHVVGNIQYHFGGSLINYGGGGTGSGYYVSTSSKGGFATDGKPAAIIVIPLEMEE
jgi:hypothetical protein